MKNKTLVLTKALLKNVGGATLKVKTKSIWGRLVIWSLIIFGVLSLMFSIGIFFTELTESFMAINQEGIVLSLGLGIDSIVVFIFGIFYVVSVFYYSDDIETLLVFPLKAREIIGAKIIIVTIYELFINITMLLPVILAYGITINAGLLYYLYGLVVILLTPLVPVCLAIIISMIIMRFTNLSKDKDTFKMVGGILSIAIALVLSYAMQKITEDTTPEYLQQLLQAGDNSFMSITSGIFPTMHFAADSLADPASMSGFANLLIFIALTFLAFIIVLYIGDVIYLKGVIGLSESASKRNKDYSKVLEKGINKSPALWACTKLELKQLFRSPIYFLNCILVNFIWPVFLFLPLIIEQNGSDMVSKINEILSMPGVGGTIISVAFAVAVFVGACNGIAPSAISREGKDLYVKKYIPVSYRVQLIAKLLSSIILGYSSMLIMVIIFMAMFDISAVVGIVILLTVWLPILFMSFVGLLIDLHNPTLDWDDEQAAVKQNVNVLINIFISLVFTIITAFITVKLSSTPMVLAIVLVLIYALLNILMYYLVCKEGAKRFYELEG